MDEGRIVILGVTIQEDGVEFIVSDDKERRKGVAVAHSYFVEFRGEEFGSRLKDAIDELQELVEDVHIGWKRLPKAAQ